MLYRNTLIKIKKSVGRYISLMVIIMVGVGFFAGIQASAPDIITAVDYYYNNHNLMDFKIVSSMGMTNDDVNALKKLKNVSKVIPSYSLDVLDQGKAIKVHAIEEAVNSVKLINGRMPQNDKECVADSKSYKIGDKVKIAGDVSEKLKNIEFTVVGTLESPLYLAIDYGNSTIGDGKLSAFIFVNRDNFILDAYTEIYVTAVGTKDFSAYSKEYDVMTSQLNDELVKIKPERETARYQEIYNKASNEINDNAAKLNDEKENNEKKLAYAKAELDENALKLKNAKEELAKSEAYLQKNIDATNADLNLGIDTFNTQIATAKSKIEKGKTELAENENKLADGYNEYNKNLTTFNTKMLDAQAKIEDAKKKLSEIKQPRWYINNRADAVIGYSVLKSGTDTISSVANVFPFFFILIVILMTSNTMARMIEEERSELGTLASLGYNDNSIIFTYLLYVLSASTLGVITGFFAGCSIIPRLIYACFNFILPPMNIRYDIMTFLLILAVAITLMTLVTVIFCNKELKQKPAALLRPVPPKNGQTILLEKIGFIWKNLSFTWKVTLRNIFRYKQRVFMTIVGIAGCTALLLAGFGMRDSINGIAEKQFGEIFNYNDLIVLNSETQNIDGDLESLLTKEQIIDPVLIRQTAFKCESVNNSLDAFLIVPQNEEIFYKYFNLKSTSTKTGTTLDDSGVIITHKISEIFKIGKGDSLTIKDADNNSYTLTVSDVAENYMNNYIYMSKELFRKVFGKPASYNMIVSNSTGNEKTLSEHLIDSDFVLNVNFKDDILQKAVEGNSGLNNVVILLVCIASLLAVIVLYNLTSINISERKREIATLKVLGFTDRETNQYIYREAFILALLSIGFGFIFGILLHRFVIGIIENDAVEFFKNIKGLSFMWAFLITMIFSVIMQIVTYFKLMKIDMIESLKSVE